MTKSVLILGRSEAVVEAARAGLQIPGLQIIGGTGIEAVRSAFAQTKIDHVIMGAGLDLDTRLEIIREIFKSSESTTVHMKDTASGPQGFLPFIQSVLEGLAGWEP